MANQVRQISAGQNIISPTDFFIEIVNIQAGDVVEIILPNSTDVLNSSLTYPYTGLRIKSNVDKKDMDYKVNLIASNGDLINGYDSVFVSNGFLYQNGAIVDLMGEKLWFCNAVFIA
jgi:hypothetical protein